MKRNRALYSSDDPASLTLILKVKGVLLSETASSSKSVFLKIHVINNNRNLMERGRFLAQVLPLILVKNEKVTILRN